ncbi:MAG: phosphoadenylyl-sulfate reductase [Candidatus Marinimicrobia bacterium]|nr:phosphoadenylyl-sulfate reductase [Candidatus Neomarinimicrobiota bacterium]MCF7829754.1 phosphoadenylyl-sulfate reductase [Candidatus Neomarinimicrobiota bacterium]MCF7881704.1 phosphoadenylyl-sulfate reductase [Candidatus Neomarinimicrobiota bacterium]
MQSITINLSGMNSLLEQLTVKDRLAWAIEEFDKLVIASSFGANTCMLIDLVYDKLGARPPVIFLDTLYHFEETLELVRRFRQKYELNLEVYYPTGIRTRQEFEQKYGKYLWERDLDKFHEITKLRSIRRALNGRDAWMTGLRRAQADTRKSAQILEWDSSHELYKINPLAEWSHEQVFRYLKENRVPYNPLYDRGYKSIGDKPLTTKVNGKEHERAGRWRGSDKTECGLHYK